MGQIVVQAGYAAMLVLLCGSRMIAQSLPVDPYSLPTVQAACGPEGLTAAAVAKREPAAAPSLDPRKARVYVITAQFGIFGSQGKPVLLGMDGRWFGANDSYTYNFVDVDIGIHHLCAASTVNRILPGTSAAVALASVDVKAGQTYYFFNRRVKVANIFGLQRINADAAAMYLQLLPSANLPKLWKAPAVQAACGPDPNHVPNDPRPTPNLPGPPAPGRALVYFFRGIPRFGSHGEPVRIGIDGQWVGETHVNSYVAVQIAPGVHRLCSSSPTGMGGKPVLWLGELEVTAGETYFVDTTTLQLEDDNLATYLLRRIAAMPKSDTPDSGALAKWSEANLPYSQSELRACGIPTVGTTTVPSSMAETADGSSGSAARVYFLLDSNRRLSQRNAVNVGLDSQWVASLRGSSWASFALSPGQHRVCIQKYDVAPFSLYLDSLSTMGGQNTYFESFFEDDGDLGASYSSTQLDPDEGAMLVALYPQASPPHP